MAIRFEFTTPATAIEVLEVMTYPCDIAAENAASDIYAMARRDRAHDRMANRRVALRAMKAAG